MNVSGQEMSNLMNNHFVEIVLPLIHESTSRYCDTNARTSLPNTMMLPPPTPFEVERLINKIKNNVAADTDYFNLVPIKYVSKHIVCHPPSYILNRTLETGIFPDKVKIPKVTPVYKGGGEQVPQNYKPIAVLLILSKKYSKRLRIPD